METIKYLIIMLISWLTWTVIIYLINNALLKAKFKYAIYISFLNILKIIVFWVVLVFITSYLINITNSIFHNLVPNIDYIDDLYKKNIYFSISLLYMILYLFIFNKLYTAFVKAPISNNYFYNIFFILSIVQVFLIKNFLNHIMIFLICIIYSCGL